MISICIFHVLLYLKVFGELRENNGKHSSTEEEETHREYKNVYNTKILMTMISKTKKKYFKKKEKRYTKTENEMSDTESLCYFTLCFLHT